MSLLRLLFSGRSPKVHESPSAHDPVAKAPPKASSSGVEQIRTWAMYPPADPGIERLEPVDLVALHQKLISRLQQSAEVKDSVFEKRYVVPLNALASYIQALPASYDKHFAGCGGLFSLCVQVAFYSVQAGGGRIYTPDRDVETHHKLEERYRYAAFLAGLLSPLAAPLSKLIVTDASGRQWPQFMMSLTDWLESNGIDRYYVSWPDSKAVATQGSEIGSIISQILPADSVRWLAEGSPMIIRDLHSVAMSGGQVERTTMGEVVRKATSSVIERDLLQSPWMYGRLKFGSTLEVHYIDAMRELASTGRWIPNDGCLIEHESSYYLKWPEALEDLRGVLRARGLTMLPSEPMTIAELLGQSEFIAQSKSGGWLWRVEAEGAEAFEGLRINRAGSIIHGLDSGELGNAQSSTATATPNAAGGMLDGQAIAAKFTFSGEVLAQAHTDSAHPTSSEFPKRSSDSVDPQAAKAADSGAQVQSPIAAAETQDTPQATSSLARNAARHDSLAESQPWPPKIVDPEPASSSVRDMLDMAPNPFEQIDSSGPPPPRATSRGDSLAGGSPKAPLPKSPLPKSPRNAKSSNPGDLREDGQSAPNAPSARSERALGSPSRPQAIQDQAAEMPGYSEPTTPPIQEPQPPEAPAVLHADPMAAQVLGYVIKHLGFGDTRRVVRTDSGQVVINTMLMSSELGNDPAGFAAGLDRLMLLDSFANGRLVGMHQFGKSASAAIMLRSTVVDEAMRIWDAKAR